MISKRDIEKVFPADEFSGVGMAGVMGIGLEFVRLFQTELEHYEKIEGETLSVEGKAQRLAVMVRMNMVAAFQGLAAVPVFVGYDKGKGKSRIFGFDITGSLHEEHDFYSVGSGSVFARGALKKLYRPGLSETEAVRIVAEALYDAADDDSATGGPDLGRRIFPSVALITDDGFAALDAGEVERQVMEVLLARGYPYGGTQAMALGPE